MTTTRTLLRLNTNSDGLARFLWAAAIAFATATIVLAQYAAIWNLAQGGGSIGESVMYLVLLIPVVLLGRQTLRFGLTQRAAALREHPDAGLSPRMLIGMDALGAILPATLGAALGSWGGLPLVATAMGWLDRQVPETWSTGNHGVLTGPALAIRFGRDRLDENPPLDAHLAAVVIANLVVVLLARAAARSALRTEQDEAAASGVIAVPVKPLVVVALTALGFVATGLIFAFDRDPQRTVSSTLVMFVVFLYSTIGALGVLFAWARLTPWLVQQVAWMVATAARSRRLIAAARSILADPRRTGRSSGLLTGAYSVIGAGLSVLAVYAYPAAKDYYNQPDSEGLEYIPVWMAAMVLGSAVFFALAGLAIHVAQTVEAVSLSAHANSASGGSSSAVADPDGPDLTTGARFVRSLLVTVPAASLAALFGAAIWEGALFATNHFVTWQAALTTAALLAGAVGALVVILGVVHLGVALWMRRLDRQGMLVTV